ncbi:MAG: hypothetical protein WDN09_01950 [bacterium]
MKKAKEMAVKAIENLDLSRIKGKLMIPTSKGGKGWTEQEVDETEKWYKRFLILHAKYPGQKIVPNGPIDTFWHQHILDTRKYGQDCEAVFGEMLHHYPYFGLNGDAETRDDAFEQTNQYYRIEFGEDCTNMFSKKKESVTAGSDAQKGVSCVSDGGNDEGSSGGGGD